MMELLHGKSLVSEAKAQETRAKMPDEATQARRRLKRAPYANWCNERVEHRAGPDRHERTNGVKRGSIPEVGFDFLLYKSKRLRNKVSKSSNYVG